MSMPTMDKPDIRTSAASKAAEVPTATDTAQMVNHNPATETLEEESFKQLLRDFVLGRSQNPDDMPGLRFYIVFAGMLALALLGVAVVATLLGLIRWIGLLFR